LSVGTAVNHNLNQFAAIQDSIVLSLDPTIANGATVRYLLQLNNGFYTVSDTIERVYGNYSTILQDNGNTMNNWLNVGNNSNWETTNAAFYSPSSSITDSKNGNYTNGTRTQLELDVSFDLTNATDARLEFWAKWNIEAGYDYVQVLAAGSNGVYTPLCGNYTKPGTNNQAFNQPLYDGLQNAWIPEKMSLNDFLGASSVKIKIILQSDFWLNEDGFYFDDFTVNTLSSNVGAQQTVLSNNFSLGQNQPNPAQLKVYIPIYTNQDCTDCMLRISDVYGRLMFQQQVGNQQGLDIYVDDWAEGIYFYQLKQANQYSEVKRMILTK
jgi:hypothetical protein